MRTAIALLLAAAFCSSATAGVFTVDRKYDRFQDKTRLVAPAEAMSQAMYSREPILQISRVVSGQDLKRPGSFSLFVLYTPSEAALGKLCDSLILLVDGKKIKMRTPNGVGMRNATGSYTWIYEVPVQRSMVASLASATKIEGQFCRAEFEVQVDWIDSWKEVLAE